MPGTVADSQSGVTAGSFAWPKVVTPRSGRSSRGQVNPVAAMTSSASTAIGSPVSVRLSCTRNASPACSIASIEASRIDTPRPRKLSSNGWTYRARTPTSDFVWTEVFAGDGEHTVIDEAQAARPDASSKPEFCLPMMKIRRPAYVGASRVSA